MSLVVAVVSSTAWAVEDTGTLEEGKWEINLAVEGERTVDGWDVASPNLELNYGAGSHGQIQLAVPWMRLKSTDAPIRTGFGAATAGFKWRWRDQDDRGPSLSVFPQYTWSVLESSDRRGVSSPNRELLLPLEMTFERDHRELSLELGRQLIEREPGDWVAGIKWAVPCTVQGTCRVELQHHWETSLTYANFGIKVPLGKAVSLKAHLGRDIGPDTPDRRTAVAGFGLEFVH